MEQNDPRTLYGSKLPEATIQELEAAWKSWHEQKERIGKARIALRSAKKVSKDQMLDLEDELTCAVDDCAFHERLYRQGVSQALLAITESERADYEEQEELRCQSQPFEIERKACFEKEQGRSLTWKQYWAQVDKLLSEMSSNAEEEYESKVRGYGWDFDAGNKEGIFDSDLGAHQHSKTVKQESERLMKLEAWKRERASQAAE